MKALVAELGGTGADGNPVRAFYLGKELNFYLHYENSIPIPVKASANSGNIIRLTRVVELKIYGVVHVPELVNVVETYLQRHHIVKLVISFFCHLIKPNLYKSEEKLLKKQTFPYKNTTITKKCGNFVPKFRNRMIMRRNSFLSSATVKKQGRTAYYKMLEDVHQGELIQVRRGVYANIDQLSGNMTDINTIVPDGILCLWSAWNIHQLTTSMPQAFHVAVKRDRKVTVPSFPKIEIHHYTESILKLGIMKMKIDGFNIRVYDVERSVCDAVKFRNKVGMDVCSEIINNYLERPNRNLSRVMDYARILRVGTILEQYLQVKL